MCASVLCRLAGMIVDIPLNTQDVKALMATFLSRRHPRVQSYALHEANPLPPLPIYPSPKPEENKGPVPATMDMGEERPPCISASKSETGFTERNRSAILSRHHPSVHRSYSQPNMRLESGSMCSQRKPDSNDRNCSQERQTNNSSRTISSIDALVDAANVAIHALNHQDGQERFPTQKEEMESPHKPCSAVETLQQIEDMCIKIEVDDTITDNYPEGSPLLMPLSPVPVVSNESFHAPCMRGCETELVEMEVADTLKDMITALSGVNIDLPTVKEAPIVTTPVCETRYFPSNSCTPSKDVAHYVECTTRDVQNDDMGEFSVNQGQDSVDNAGENYEDCLTTTIKNSKEAISPKGIEGTERSTGLNSSPLIDIRKPDMKIEAELVQESLPNFKSPEIISSRSCTLTPDTMDTLGAHDKV